jgi:hypothetical protein
MPSIDPIAEQQIEYVVKTLGTATWVALWKNHSVELKDIGQKIVHVHPFQFLEVIFREASKVSQHMPVIFRYNLLTSNFVNGLRSGFERPEHKAKTPDYLHSFATRVKISHQSVHDHLQQRDIEGLVQALIKIHCQK